MNLYKVMELEAEIEALAAGNDGEIEEAKFEQLILAQTQAVGKLEKLCQFLRNLEVFDEAADIEIERIAEKRKKAKKMASQIKSYITPYVVSKGKVVVGTFTLTTRKSKAVVILDEGVIPAKYFETKIVETETLNKKAVKEAVEAGEDVPGAILEIRDNLQIK